MPTFYWKQNITSLHHTCILSEKNSEISTTISTQVHMILLIIKLTWKIFSRNRSSTWTIFWLNRSSEKFRNRSRDKISQIYLIMTTFFFNSATTNTFCNNNIIFIKIVFFGYLVILYYGFNVLPKYKDGKSEEFLLESAIQHLSVFDWNTITLTLKASPRANKNKSEVSSV